MANERAKPMVALTREGFAWNPMRDYPRNQPCPCGSQAKFKRCCLPKMAACVPVEKAEKMKHLLKQMLARIENGQPALSTQLKKPVPAEYEREFLLADQTK